MYSSPNIIRNVKSRRLTWAGHVARLEQSRNPYRVLVGKPEGRRPLGRLRRRWEDDIKVDLREVSCDSRDWIALAEDRDQWRACVRAVINFRVPSKPISYYLWKIVGLPIYCVMRNGHPLCLHFTLRIQILILK